MISGTVKTTKARVLDDGGSWAAGVDGTFDHHLLRVENSMFGTPTTLEIQHGASVGTDNPFPAVFSVEILESSIVRMSGGLLQGSLLAVHARDSSALELYDGVI